MREGKIRGLSKREVREYRRAGLTNKPVVAPSKTVREIVVNNVFTYFNFVFFFLAIILLFVRSFRDLSFLPIIILNTVIGILQELKAKEVLDKLTVLNAPRARVIRNGTESEIAAEDLVLNDIVRFKAGDQIPADAKVIGGSVSANEALLTGEEDEVDKSVGDELLSGSFIVSGECYAQLTQVGADSYISKLTLQAKAIKTEEESEIIRSLNKIVKLAGIAIIPIGIILFSQGFFFSDAGAKASVQAMVAAIIGMIPEGLFLLASVTLAISAMRLGASKVLLHDMKSIELLARVNVLCLDKTGTITDGSMSVQEMVPLIDDTEAEQMMTNFAVAQKADNITMVALKEFFNKVASKKPKKVLGFSSKYKYSGVEFADETLILGAPDFLIKDKKLLNMVTKYNKQGLRVLALGKVLGLDGECYKGPFKPVALVTLTNQIRENAAQTFAYFVEQGVKLKVISGDNPETVAEIAKQAGIADAEDYVDASELDDAELERAVKKYTVFGRVTPEQKRKMIKALQRAGNTVAMTGDGVNDVLALKDADCSIAFGSGSDAAIQASQVVLLDSDFAKMPKVVAEGRRVVNNLERSGSLFLVKNIFSFLMALLAIIFSFRYPLLPTQISLVTLWTIGVPSFLLAQIPNKELIKGKFITKILAKAFPAALADVILVMAMVLCGAIFDLGAEQVSTGCTIIMSVVGLIYLFKICMPFNLLRKLIFVGCLLGMGLCLVFMKWVFAISDNMSVRSLVIIALLSFLAWPIMRVTHDVSGKIWRKISKLKLIKKMERLL
ncbi:HAD-IC family P-type ATPase [Candidatus Saccharibacteria bacterium]|nr:HAD-IC family P-type ATPase [Candidatus Saccharibacteria bacterium]